jgi:hypothetical protein
LNLATQRGLGDAQTLRRVSKMQFLGHSDEIPQLTQLHNFILMPNQHYRTLPMYWTYQAHPAHSRELYF